MSTPYIDTGVFTQQAISGTAQLVSDPAAAVWATLFKGMNTALGTEALTAAGALDPLVFSSTLAVSGTMAMTLAAPTFARQRKVVRCVTAASTPAATLTVASPDTTAGFVCPASFFFDTVGQEIELEATTGLLWRCIRVKRAGGTADNVVVGTTAITNKLWLRYCLSVTGTVNSTLPNGSTVGERIQIINTTAASTPIGGLAGTFVGGAAVAYTALGAFGVVASTTVVGDCALLEWDGSAWAVLFQSGTILS